MRKLNSKGQAMVEYGLILALIAVVCFLAITTVGTAARGKFQQIAAAL